MMNGLIYGNAGAGIFSDAPVNEGKKSKRGPRTIQDNFLEGSRNAWVQLLEESWLRIGLALLRIRDKRTSNLADVRKAFEPVKEALHNPGLAASFYHSTLEPAKPGEVLKIRRQVGELDAEIIKSQAKLSECFRSCLDADRAMKMAEACEVGVIRNEALTRLQGLLETAFDLKRLESDRDGLHQKTVNQAAYVFQSELLNFLLSRRYAVNPRNLGDALAGLPHMKWRQSFDRCCGMQFNPPAQEYEVWELLSEICSRLPERGSDQSTTFFRTELLKRSRSLDHTRRFICDRWRDLRLAIEECWKERNESPDGLPFLLSSAFMRNARKQKDAREQILTDAEKLPV